VHPLPNIGVIARSGGPDGGVHDSVEIIVMVRYKGACVPDVQKWKFVRYRTRGANNVRLRYVLASEKAKVPDLYKWKRLRYRAWHCLSIDVCINGSAFGTGPGIVHL
jgi:hypothetical protein